MAHLLDGSDIGGILSDLLQNLVDALIRLSKASAGGAVGGLLSRGGSGEGDVSEEEK